MMISYDSKILLTWTKSTRRAFGVYTQTRHFQFSHGFVLILMMFFILDASEANGIHVPFTIRIQTLMQLQAMFQFDHNGLIFMDATFGTNNVKYLLFTLMAFNFHCTRVPIVWVITS
jgi:hypothetical protein